MRSVAFCTLGCKVNQYETDAMEEIFLKAGYEIKDFHEKADIYVINTCTVTNMADRKSRQMIHRAKRKNPEAVIVAAGCYVEAAGEAVQEDASIDLIIGNNCKSQIVSMVEAFIEEHQKIVCKTDINHNCDYETMTISKVSEHTRAYIKIQDGCNQFCSYCIIPYARGRVRSRKPEDIFSEVFSLAKAGYKEIVLTGIHISSYGKDFEEQENLISLVEKLAVIEGIERIRFGSLEPGFITEDVVVRLAAIEKICPHFHLSLQSGCNETLKRMNRHYTAEEYEEKCNLLRRYFDRPSFTTDVIVGFPGETEEEFEQTEAFLEKIHFAEMHIFKYSPRKGTRAAVMPNQIDEHIKTERSAKLLALAEKMSADYQDACRDKVLQILIEEKVPSGDGEVWIGHSREYLKCAVQSDKIRSNDLVNCQMTRTKGEDFVFCKIID
ncbi:tRNA (N(6)-L-threonylcarbamoyladenosine(37)-C(2))-methylthiotransferase MtaB [Frisingicoccus sp.]|uniref:tRNA (N(6)-L-threonylcarbamoyladenosine(37)-C(2))- methylthiotransferase MtaB n=1 Tax=Frisingicoccus sp. TaxID=1918627 RepID=UPI002A81C79D|nr:tRNA (N(6)-L-threonylcarbamoyladenosine(37)-C(2))-methylthiotransferase MtaB [Frisingicoccus sp.]MDY4922062.1 tRNA (N(6)-L-threonylcarbamoyladenosine(37)-C(2))-methylthiotransferase MtaB [Frisingicoccus sp.]